ncbi:hypothetical protein DPMN_073181 [Dreissena polymorpha]|uniref:Secreted protein n=1 Tax=Dreissena polymorpha TaxID=45954 RepID=A0A9D4BYP8_DREPO|nr:hypothetical protein DPMN_073181 [Dreissena polymorpha]
MSSSPCSLELKCSATGLLLWCLVSASCAVNRSFSERDVSLYTVYSIDDVPRFTGLPFANRHSTHSSTVLQPPC